MKFKRIVIEILIFVMLLGTMAGCDSNKEEQRQIEDSQEQRTEDELLSAWEEEQAEREETKNEEIPIDFPFLDSEAYMLTLASIEDAPEEYELRLYGQAGEIRQQISCGKLAEPIQFTYDGLSYGAHHDLEIFPAEGSTGMLFIWEDGCFAEEGIEIPRYVELRNAAMLTITKDEKCLEKKIYLLNEDKGRIEEVRSFELRKDTGFLKIWDGLEKQSLFEGNVRLDENGNLVNQEYCELLLWSDINKLWNYQGESSIDTWVGEKAPEETETKGIDSFEGVQNYVFGNPGHTQEYESRQALLRDFGFADSEPMYQYFDRYGNLQLELYADENVENICGLSYEYGFNSELEKTVSMTGFTLCMIPEAEWQKPEIYLTQSVYGTDGKEWVEEYEEIIEYRDDGQPDFFKTKGTVDGRADETVLEINYIYREDGTLFSRDYSHNTMLFSTTLCSLKSYYDENERVVFERGYITHGHCEYYYIYEDESDTPSYVLYIDYNLNYAIPSMIKCS